MGKTAGWCSTPGQHKQRPTEVETKTILGHWKGDTVVGAERQDGVLTVVERVTKVLRIVYLPQATAQAVEEVTVESLKGLQGGVKTITFDNSKEFTNRQKIAQRLEYQVILPNLILPPAAAERIGAGSE